jgi:PAS domain S-box-containing protein
LGRRAESGARAVCDRGRLGRLCFLARWSLGASFGDRPLLMLFVVPILLSAYLGGLGAGLLATGLAAASATYFLPPPSFSVPIGHSADGVQWLGLWVIGVLASALAEAQHRSRRLVQQAREEREEQFRSMADALPQLAWMARPDGHMYWFNERWHAYTGVPSGQAEGWGWQSLVDPSLLPAVLEQWTASLTTGRPFDMEFPLRGGDGLFRWFLTRSVPLRDPDGRAFRWLGTHTDISEKREAEEALRRSEAELQTICDNISDGLVVADLEGTIFYWNRTALEMHGLASLEEGRRRLPDFAHTFELATMDGTVLPLESWPLARVLRGECLRDLDVHVRRFENDWRRVFSYNGDLVRDTQGSPLLACITIRDITVRKEAEAALRGSEERYRALVECSPLAVLVNRDQRVTFVNPAAVALWGATGPEQLLGKSAFELFHRDCHETIAARMRCLLDGHAVPAIEEKIVRIDGTTRAIECVASPFVDQGGRAIQVVLHDITDRRRAEAERERLLSEVEARSGELESLLYVASHDLRAPLVNIQGFGRRLEGACAELCEQAGQDERARERIQERIAAAIHFIQASGTKMDALIGGLLRVSRTGRATIRAERLDMNRLVEAILASMRIQIEDAEAVIDVAGLPPCWADAGQIDQVLTNLIDNALKYRDPGRPLRIRITGEAAGTRSVYCVADTGPGIAAAHGDKVWELFHRLNPRESIAGEGLGLTLVKRIVERHGGRVWLESTVSEGSRFFVSLPEGSR